MPWQPNRIEQERLEKAQALEQAGIDLYPRRVQRTHTAAAAIEAYLALESADPQAADSLQVTVCGRVRRVNIKGKVSFMHIEDGTGRIQLFLRVNDMNDGVYEQVKEKRIEMDDFVQATGVLMRTQAGEISVRVSDLTLLAKSLSPLPVIKQQVQDDGTVIEYGEFSDVEQRYRQRYADLAVNADVREVFRKRARVISSIRQFLDDEGFLEVETPVLQPIYGGAAARPFTTHHNQLDQELFLRISFELYLKRLLVGGFDAVYEIGRDFRNEGVSFKHNPEFTQMEFYKAYIDYNGVMDIVERMMVYVCQRVTGGDSVAFQGQTIHIHAPFTRLRLREAIIQFAEIDYMQYPDAESLTGALHAQGDRVTTGQTWGKLIDHLLSKYVEPRLIQPTFITDYPRDVSPFAKRVAYDDFHVERFEVFMAGMELGNAFTELNDPRDQQQRFVDMQRLYADEDDEAAPLDEDYLRAMRYGMPPNGGFGMGIDRFTMLLTDQRSIRDVLLYPHLRDEK
jgi:lysyl-tRNA synthetase class 2